MGASPELAVTALQEQHGEALGAAAEAGLRYVSDLDPGIRRVRSDSGFAYRDHRGLIRSCQQLPGQALFQYRDDDGRVQPVDSGHINDYLRDAMGEGFTAKDFRTWGGTLAAFHLLSSTPLPGVGDGTGEGKPLSERALVAAEKAVLAQVGRILGNTPSVCRKAYVDPMVFAGWRDGSLQRAARKKSGSRPRA